MGTIDIIICDDENEIHDDLKKSLESARDAFFDFRIIQDFYETNDLKQYLRKHKFQEDSDTVLLLDNIFNGRADGLQALSNIRHHCPKMPIIFLTTCNDDNRQFTLAKEKYQIEYIQKSIEGTALRFRIETAIENMKNNELKDTLKNIETKIDGLTDFVKNDMQDKILKEKALFANVQQDFNDDVIISEFISRLSNYINTNLNKQSDFVNKEERSLVAIFGEIWDKLLQSTKISLVSAGVIWKSCENITHKNFDYSGVCISATSALETELKKIFFKDFQGYISNKYGKPNELPWQETFKFWPERLLTCTRWNYESAIRNMKRPRLEISDNFTMGTLPYLFGREDRKYEYSQCKLMCDRMSEYLKTIVKDQFKDDPIKTFYSYSKSSFVNKCEDVRNLYRNKAAHTDIIDKSLAKECFETIAGKIGLIITMYQFLQ